MHIHVLARTQSGANHIPLAGLTNLSKALASDECTVDPDIRPAISRDFESAVVQLTGDQLLRSGKYRRPDVIHAFGTIATAGAMRFRPPGTLVVATFDEFPTDHDLELELARQADAVLPASQADEEVWRSLGVRTLSFGGVPALPIVALPHHPQRHLRVPRCDVVTSSHEDTLDALVEALPSWGGGRLLVVGRPQPSRWQDVVRHARALGVAERLQLRSDEHLALARAVVFVAGREVARSGAACLNAAAHGVPAIAWAGGGHLDAVLPGVTGRLIDPGAGAAGIAQSVGPLLADNLASRALGECARVRVRSLHEPVNGGERLQSLYCCLLEQSIQTSCHKSKLAASKYTLVLDHLPYAAQLARRYAGRGQSLDDLVQVANLGLVHAAARFDPERGKDFYSFATPTIQGELRKHFRDNAWAVHVPRSLQESSLRVQRASEERAGAVLATTPADLAAVLGLPEAEVLLAQRVHLEARSAHSLDLPVGDGSGEFVSDKIGEPDPALDIAEKSGDVRAALRRLPEPEREMLLQRFYGERTQAEIGDSFGISQVQVSRVLSRTLAAIRDHLLYDAPLPTGEDSQHPRVRAA